MNLLHNGLKGIEVGYGILLFCLIALTVTQFIYAYQTKRQFQLTSGFQEIHRQNQLGRQLDATLNALFRLTLAGLLVVAISLIVTLFFLNESYSVVLNHQFTFDMVFGIVIFLTGLILAYSVNRNNNLLINQVNPQWHGQPLSFVPMSKPILTAMIHGSRTLALAGLIIMISAVVARTGLNAVI
ncbi:hypothetical protein [Levilactobacillus bambusae]|uniref:Uncharacterized protein n=1 Tax=Levilactobacillus bambusae TaxID=2024736 RepID=A0A2V1MZF6_9LACO|nr:hypothetical protein [Levilactobacillus bambusae]PWF99479.1 hypothetical protein DCM90_08505 [Levilactobacillus bambusae]